MVVSGALYEAAAQARLDVLEVTIAAGADPAVPHQGKQSRHNPVPVGNTARMYFNEYHAKWRRDNIEGETEDESV